MPNQIVICNGCVIEHPRYCDCTVCVDAWCEWMETQRQADRLALLDVELRKAKPATREEWAEFWDAEFPRVQHG